GLYRTEPNGMETLVRTFPLEPNAETSFLDQHSTPGSIARYRLEVSALGMTWNYETSIISPAPLARERYLSRVTPNPFRDRTVITYRIPRGDPTHRVSDTGKPDPATNPPPGGELAPRQAEGTHGRYKIVRAEIDIFNLAGRRVRSFPSVHSYEGIYSEPVVWDGRDDSGKRLPAGLYFIRLRADEVWETRKVILLQ
ncbi:MAG: FlgD immunoglobulin-like domain containing protein, partial [Candidatus Eisenbacteria bacterium]